MGEGGVGARGRVGEGEGGGEEGGREREGEGGTNSFANCIR